MQEAFTIVLFVVVAVAAVAAIWALVTSGGAYEQIGRGGTSLGEERTDPGDREAEIRQLLEARNARRLARGEAPLDVEAELERLRET
jgi:hypothetical protein